MFAIYVIQYSNEGYLQRYQPSIGLTLANNINDARLFPSFNAAEAYIKVLKESLIGLRYTEVISLNSEVNTEVEYLYED